ncbi:MAG: bifunctional methylenetetrahydrofolate dehydrogenase/methenyltetrahydrofolate cyclohydrolase FolD [Firmicutes bacterium]|jgi:methylenetetrahydrofolate dehydrogenase (NADP+)/methenyltetrahydrofolate cyclohydrolase|nr:bifunctional methylenetetrahydrofolate dehydrogenase/methenyltetrahydrofolate cyclohydrolase FolD [Bacillota bacterium]
MSATIIDGKAIAAEIRRETAAQVAEMKAAKGIIPGLAVILVGEDPASKRYVRNKERACQEVGIYSEVYRLPESTSQEEVMERISVLNRRPEIHGILLQLPLPDHIDEKACLVAIDPAKDVDGFHPVNVGKMVIGDKCLLPCTPHGIIVLLERSGIEIKGKSAVVVGRSNIVGKPVSMLLLHRHATVTMCHSRTRDLGAVTREAEILVVAVGKPKVVTGDMIREGAVVIDVGVNEVEGKLVGDVDFESAVEKASAITPVPGGVGPMTITMLLKNTVEAAGG